MRNQLIVISEKIAVKLMYRQIFRREGYTVYTAGRISDIDDYLNIQIFTIVLIDLTRFSPQWSFEITRFLNKNPEVAVFVVTTHKIEALAFPAAAKVYCFSKPLDYKSLKKTIKEVILYSDVNDKTRLVNSSIKTAIFKKTHELSLELRQVADKVDKVKSFEELKDTFKKICSIYQELENYLIKNSLKQSGAHLNKNAITKGNNIKVNNERYLILEKEHSKKEQSDFIYNKGNIYKTEFKKKGEYSAWKDAFSAEKIVCPICGQNFYFWYPDDVYCEVESFDFDQMPVFSGANKLIYDFCICPFCKYTALRCDFEIKDEKLIEQIKKINFPIKKFHLSLNAGYPRSLRDAINLCRAASFFCLARHNIGYLGNINLKGAWIARVLGSWTIEKEFLQNTLYFYEEAMKKRLLNGGYSVEQEMNYLLGELSLRLGLVKKSEEYFVKILKYGEKGNLKIWEKARNRLAGEVEQNDIPWQK